jgi:tagaturonate reductase
MKNNSIQILQFGTGNFLRAFIEPMVQQLQEIQKPLNICIIQSTGGNSLEGLKKQNFQYHVAVAGIEKGEKKEEILLINCIKEGLNLPEDNAKFMNFASDPEVKWIVSNVTEAGMVWKNEQEIEVFAESFAGRLTQWLYRRFQTLPEAPTVILPCELLPKNGDFLKDLILKHAFTWNLPKEFNNWLDQKCRFFNTLVDRIVPGFPSHLELKEKENDSFLVQTEPYFFWAIEGNESDRELLPFLKSKAEVILNHSIDFYALRKIRILNGLHTFMAAKGILEGYHTVGEYVAVPSHLDELQQLLEEEVFPTLPAPKEELQPYANQVIDRFRNPFVAHKLADISLNSIAKFKSRLLPIFEFHLHKKGSIPPIASLGLVALVIFYLRNTEQIKDTTDIKSYFSTIPDSLSELEKVKKCTNDLFGLNDEVGIEKAYGKLRKTR